MGHGTLWGLGRQTLWQFCRNSSQEARGRKTIFTAMQKLEEEQESNLRALQTQLPPVWHPDLAFQPLPVGSRDRFSIISRHGTMSASRQQEPTQ